MAFFNAWSCLKCKGAGRTAGIHELRRPTILAKIRPETGFAIDNRELASDVTFNNLSSGRESDICTESTTSPRKTSFWEGDKMDFW